MAEYTLRDYQVEDLAFAIANPKSMNLSAPGTGKTGPACVLSWYYWNRFQKKTVWAMPLSLMRQNRSKMLRFTDYGDDDVAILSSDHGPLTKDWAGPTKIRQKKVRSRRVRITPAIGKPYNTHERAMTGDEVNWAFIKGPDGTNQVQKGYTEDHKVKDLIAACDAKVIIVSFAFLRSHWEHLLEVHPDLGLFEVDEHHLGFKKSGSGQTEAFFHVSRHCDGLYMMTGSLIDGQLDSVFPAIHAIEPRYYGSHQGFLDQHAIFIDDYGRVQGWKNTDKLTSIIKQHGVNRTFEFCYGKEPVVFFHELVEVTPKVREEYDLFHQRAMIELEDGRVVDGTLPGVNVIRARQILAHPETMGLGKGEDTGKDERLKIFAAEGQKMLVFAALKPEQRRCVEVLRAAGLRVGLINSDISGPERSRVDELMNNGNLDAIVASGPTAGVGWNWEMVDHVVFASVDYQDVNFLQAYRRASRGTRTTTLRVTSLEYEDTIDGRQYAILTEKSALANQVDETRPVLSFTG